MCWTRKPPTIGPAAVEAPMTPAQMPRAAFSLSTGNVSRRMASAVGISMAPKKPCATRKAITSEMLLAVSPERPMPAENKAKPTIPVTKTFLCPKRSPTLPMVIKVTASASMYPFMIHWMSASDAWRWDWIDGFATATMVPSSATIITPKATATKVKVGLPRQLRRALALSAGPSPVGSLGSLSTVISPPVLNARVYLALLTRVHRVRTELARLSLCHNMTDSKS